MEKTVLSISCIQRVAVHLFTYWSSNCTFWLYRHYSRCVQESYSVSYHKCSQPSYHEIFHFFHLMCSVRYPCAPWTHPHRQLGSSPSAFYHMSAFFHFECGGGTLDLQQVFQQSEGAQIQGLRVTSCDRQMFCCWLLTHPSCSSNLSCKPGGPQCIMTNKCHCFLKSINFLVDNLDH